MLEAKKVKVHPKKSHDGPEESRYIAILFL
jgi:hypothetical protein